MKHIFNEIFIRNTNKISASVLSAVCSMALATSAQADPNPSGNPLQVYTRGTDNCLHENYLNQSNLAFDYWLGWAAVTSICDMASAPSSASLDVYDGGTITHQIHVVYRRNDNHIVDVRYNGSSWATVDLGGIVYDAPGLVNVQDGQWFGHLALFVRGTDNNLWTKTLAGSDGTDNWGNWAMAAGNGDMASAPSVSMYTNSSGAKQIELVYRRNDNHIVQRYNTVEDASGNTVSTAWSAETDLGGVTYSAPSGIAWDNTGFYVFHRGTDNNIYVKTYWSTAGWSNWFIPFNAAGAMASGPTTVVRNSRSGTPQMHVFWRRNDNTVVHEWYESTWAQDNIGGATSDAPSSMYYSHF